MKTPSKQNRPAPRMNRLQLTALAASCALAFAASAQAQTNGVVSVTTSNLLASDAAQTLSSYGFDLTLLSAQHNAATLTADVLSNVLTATFVTGTDTALTISGNAVSASAGSNQVSNRVDLSLLGSGTNPFAIAAANSQLRVGSTTTAGVTDQLIEARSSDTQNAPTTISGNSVSATATLNTASTTVSGVTNAAFNSASGVGASIGAPDSLATVTANVAVVNAQTAANASGNSGSRAALTNANIIASATGAPVEGINTLSEVVTISNNAMSAGYSSNSATTSYIANPGSAAFKGGVIVANVQTDIESAPSVLSSQSSETAATAKISNSNITVDVRQGAGAGTVLSSAATVSGNRIAATSEGNRAGALDSSGRLLAGNVLIVDSSTSVSSDLVTSALGVANLQQSTGTRYVSSINNTQVTALADNVSPSGSMTLRDNSLAATATGNLAGNLASVSGDAISTNLQVTSGQSVSQSVLASIVDGASLKAIVGGEESSASTAGSLTMSGNSVSARADGNIGANTLIQRAASVLGTTNSASSQRLEETNIQAELSDANAVTRVTAGAIRAATINTANNTLSAVANGNIYTGSSSLQASQVGTSANALVNSNGSYQDASNVEISAAAEGAVTSTVAGALTDSRVTVNGNATAASAIGNRASQLTEIVTTSLRNQLTTVDSTQNASGAVSSTVNGAIGLTVSDGSPVTGSTLTVSGNSAQAVAIGSTALNTLAISASSIGGSGGTLNVSSTQTGSGLVSSTAIASQGINSVGAIDSSSITLSGNRTSAAALGQSASNRLQVTSNEISGQSANVYNTQQRSGGDVVASVSASGSSLFGVNVDLAGNTPITVTGNRADASAMQNDAVNVLQASATSLSAPVGSAALVVDNLQTSTGNSFSAVSGGLIGLQATSLTAGNAVVSDNRVTASAGINTATNAIVVDATSALNANSIVTSVQNATGAVDASVGGLSQTTIGVIAPLNSGVALNALNATVSGNMLMAQGTANAVTNILNASSANSIGTAGAIAPIASYALNNVQASSGPVSTLVANTVVGLGGGQVSGAALTVSGNTISAVSTSNTASNQLNLTVLPGSAMQASSSLTNAQSSSSAVSAQVSGVTVIAGASAPSNPGARSSTISGNNIAAQATGNTAVNQITGR